MSNQKNPPKWVNVYPQGTKEGDEEQKFFISLARHPKYEWRSVAAISSECGLTKKRVEEILAKYYKKGMVFQNPKNDEQWGYWERVPYMLKDNTQTIVDKDQQKRIDGACKEEDEDEEDCDTNQCSCGPKGCQGHIGSNGKVPNPYPNANPVSPRAIYPLDWDFTAKLKEVYEAFRKDGWYSVECTVRHDVDSKTGEIMC